MANKYRWRFKKLNGRIGASVEFVDSEDRPVIEFAGRVKLAALNPLCADLNAGGPRRERALRKGWQR